MNRIRLKYKRLRETVAEQQQHIDELEADNARLKQRVNALLKTTDPISPFLPINGELFKVVFSDA